MNRMFSLRRDDERDTPADGPAQRRGDYPNNPFIRFTASAFSPSPRRHISPSCGRWYAQVTCSSCRCHRQPSGSWWQMYGGSHETSLSAVDGHWERVAKILEWPKESVTLFSPLALFNLSLWGMWFVLVWASKRWVENYSIFSSISIMSKYMERV